MKARWINIPTTALMVISAGLALTTAALTTSALVIEPLAAQRDIIQTPAPEELVKKSGCLRCHSVDKMVKGPSFHDIAERYKNDARARASLIKTVRDGGKGHWTELTGGLGMPPHSARLSMVEIERLVDWVLSR
ncbi:MAG: c-type cytochrome [Pyrinomonadaceae bacterium]